MAIALSVRGKVKAPMLGKTQPHKVLAKILKWVIEHSVYHIEELPPKVQQGEGEAQLSLFLHPAAEPVELFCDASHLIISARTSAAGPGYHQHICEFIDELGKEFQIAWLPPDEEHLDESGYFVDRDRESLEQEMLAWFTGLAEVSSNQGQEHQSLCMPMDPQFTTKCEITTPMGPRTSAWLKSASRDFDIARSFFPWWDEGETATVVLNRAKVLMWCNLRWAIPETEGDGVTHERVSQLLMRAYELDAAAEIPWRNWKELLEHDSGFELEPAMVALVNQMESNSRDTPIGYRRDPVDRNMGGWSFTHPGDFYEQVGEDGDISFGRGGRFIRCMMMLLPKDTFEEAPEFLATMMQQQAPTSRPLPPQKLQTEHGLLLGQAADCDSDVPEEPGFYIQGAKAKLGCRLILTIGYPTQQQRQWAIDTWESFK